MTFMISEAARTYLGDKVMRASIDDLLNTKRSGAHLPWREARELARARLMAEVARADVIELLFALWEEVWGRHVTRLGGELVCDDDLQASFMPQDVWDERTLGRTFRLHVVDVAPNGGFVRLIVSIWDDDLTFTARIALFDSKGKSLLLPDDIEGWIRQPEDDDWYDGAVAVDAVDADAFAADPEVGIARMRKAADDMVAWLLEYHP